MNLLGVELAVVLREKNGQQKPKLAGLDRIWVGSQPCPVVQGGKGCG